MRKILLSLGSLCAVIAPISLVVACGKSSSQPTQYFTIKSDNDGNVKEITLFLNYNKSFRLEDELKNLTSLKNSKKLTKDPSVIIKTSSKSETISLSKLSNYDPSNALHANSDELDVWNKIRDILK